MAAVKRRPVPRTGDKPKESSITQSVDSEINETTSEEVIKRKRPSLQEIIEKNNRKEVETMIMEKEISNGYELELFQPAISKTKDRGITGVNGVMSVINAKSGKRLILSSSVMEELNRPTLVAISFSDNKIAIAEQLPNNTNLFKVKHSSSKGIIYSAGIINEITEKYHLDFSNRSSITFTEVDYIYNDGVPVAIISVMQN